MTSCVLQPRTTVDRPAGWGRVSRIGSAGMVLSLIFPRSAGRVRILQNFSIDHPGY